MLSRLPLDKVLQQVGDAVAVAVTEHTPGTAELAPRCIAELNERGWEGDEELAQQLAVALGQHMAPRLRPLLVDLEELSWLLEGDPAFGGGRLDLATGDCWPEQADPDELDADHEDEDEDADRWLPVPCQGSRDGYRDMETFITTVTDAGFANRLEVAISGLGAFRRFKDVLARDEDKQRRFHLFADERQHGRARAWLAMRGYRPTAAASR